MKRLAVKLAASGQDPLDIQVHPGNTAGEVLSQLNLEGYLLSSGPNSNHFFGSEENIYPAIADGDKLYAITKAEVGA